MSDLTLAIRLVLVRELDTFCREIEAFPDDALVWQTAPGVSNACGNLALHAAANLQHFIGARLGNTGYVRQRHREFSERSGTRADLVAELGRAREVVTTVLERLPDEAWARPYPDTIGGVQLSTGVFLIHLASHLAFHLGQAGYLRRMLTGENRSVGPVAIPALAALLDARDGN